MASDSVYTAEINLKELTIKTVTLGPRRATVIAEIEDVTIKPGPNEIAIYGLDPEVDLDSIRVTGCGQATITDIQTEVVPQREKFEDIYSYDSEDEEIVEEEDPNDDFGVDRTELNRVEDELKALESQMAAARNEQNTANASLDILDSYGRSMKAGEVDIAKIADYLQVYQKERARLAELHQQSNLAISKTKQQIDNLLREKRMVESAFFKARNAAARPQRLEREKRWKELDVKSAEKRRIMRQRRSFWPYNVARVVLHLDGLSDFTPGSSHRNSLVSTKKPEPTTEGLDKVSFSLNYVTTKAAWSPRYELNLETPSLSGKIVYRAEYYNYSSETWKDTQLILSTSQTSFSGIEEKTPNLQPWNVKLLTDHLKGRTTQKLPTPWEGGLENSAEVAARMSTKKPQQKVPSIQPRPMQQQYAQQMLLPQQQQQQQQQQQPQQQMQQQSTYLARMDGGATGGLFGAPAPKGPAASSGFGTFGSTNNQSNTVTAFGQQPPQPDPVPECVVNRDSAGNNNNNTTTTNSNQDYQMQLMMLEQQNRRRLVMARQEQDELYNNPEGYKDDSDFEGYESDAPDFDAETLSASTRALTFQETSRQDYGLTTTYNIPGQRTITPSSLKRRHVIADLKLSNITFSHVIIPKLRPAAFLRARITNTSTTSLLRGKAGLTLDGTFLGTTTIPSCSPDSIFTLSLGVDPGIQVSYAKPTVRRATSGFFNKEDCAIFTRVCRITNTKSTSISVAVHDQVPVSEDERLRVGILEPKGLHKEGDTVKVGPEVSTVTASTTGSSAAAAAVKGNSSGKSWGKGTVGLGKEGHVTWQLTLEKGKAVKLTLEYEAKIPSGQRIVGLD